MTRFRVRDLPRLRDQLHADEQIMQREQSAHVTAHTLQSIASASLWWVSEDMTRLAVDTSHDLPDWTPGICRPAPDGLIYFSGTPALADAPLLDPVSTPLGTVPHHRVPARAMLWTSLADMIRVITYTDPAEAGTTGIGRILVDVDAIDVDADRPIPAGAFESLAMLGTAWLLMQQPTIAEHRTVETTRRRRGGTAPAPEASEDDVQIIDLRRLARPDRETDADGDGASREYRHRWLVRGHWRQQRVGPGRTHTRPVYVAPHIRGPEGAPLMTERVNVWRR